MGNALSLLGRGETKMKENNVLNQEVVKPDASLERSTVDCEPEEDLFKDMGHGSDVMERPFFLVNGVACFTREQLDIELRKVERRRMDRVLSLIDEERSWRELEDTNTVDLLNDIEKCSAQCKRMREIAEKLQEMKVEIIHMEHKQGTMEDLRNVQHKRPVFPINRHAKKIRNVRARQIINKIGEMFVKLQIEEENKRALDNGSSYTYFVTIQPSAGASNCTIELVGQTGTDAVPEEPQN
ncbi:hypothetical protein KR038_008715 [Drosophila bunnanda]|nr:hypothetical protein KR038_008715 [Drosophila bunnanda]